MAGNRSGRKLPLLLVIVIVGSMLMSWTLAASAASPVRTSATVSNQAVSIANFFFSPTPLTVNVGDTVTWTNNGPSFHTTTSNTDLWSSLPLAVGATFSQTFNTAGTFDYHCAIHPALMHGTILVGPDATTNTPTPTLTSTPTPTATVSTTGATLTPTPTPTGGGSSVITSLVDPVRLADTRASGGPVSSSAPRCFRVAGVSGIPADAGAVILNVTSTGQTSNGWLTLYPDGQPVPAKTSTLNFTTAAYAVANGAAARVGNNGQVCVSVGTLDAAPGSAHVILDATGYLAASALSQLTMLPSPMRVADTRNLGGPIPTGGSQCFQMTGVAAAGVGIPADAAAVVLNVTAVGYSTNGWLTVYPSGQPSLSTSTVNFDQAEYAVANNAVARVGTGGQVCVSVGTVNSAPGSSHVVLDVTGYLTGAAARQLPMLTSPQRIVDTRAAGGPITGGTSRCFTVGGLAGIPATASGVVVNTTAVGYRAPGWLTVYPGGQAVPATSTLDFDTSEYAVANGAIVALGSGGQLCVGVASLNSVAVSSNIILDVVGYLP